MKKALAGPAKPAAKKKPKRRAMIAAAQRRIRPALAWAAKSTRAVDPAVDRRIERARTVVAKHARRLGKTAARWATRVGRRLRPAAVLRFRGLARIEQGLRRAGARTARAATRASAVITPERAICGVVVASAICLIVSQFVDYRAVEIGQPGYAGLPTVTTPPTVDVKTAGEAHSYLLVPLALLAAVLGLAAVSHRRRWLGRVVFALGLAGIAVVLLVDLPNGLDAGAQASRFAGARATLYEGFYAELAASAGLALGGLALSLNRRPARHRLKRPRRTRGRRAPRGRTKPLAESRT